MKGNFDHLPCPSIAGIDIGAGHFIAILKKTKDAYIIHDPLIGTRKTSEKDVLKRTTFTGFFLVVK